MLHFRHRTDPDRNFVEYRDNACLLKIAHSPSFEKVMYNINPAVIKSILASMPNDQLIVHMRYIRRQAAASVPGSNRRSMFVSLYQYCENLLQKGHSIKVKKTPRF